MLWYPSPGLHKKTGQRLHYREAGKTLRLRVRIPLLQSNVQPCQRTGNCPTVWWDNGDLTHSTMPLKAPPDERSFCRIGEYALGPWLLCAQHLCSQEEATTVSLQARVHLIFGFKFYCSIKSRHARKRAYYAVISTKFDPIIIIHSSVPI